MVAAEKPGLSRDVELARLRGDGDLGCDARGGAAFRAVRVPE